MGLIGQLVNNVFVFKENLKAIVNKLIEGVWEEQTQETSLREGIQKAIFKSYKNSIDDIAEEDDEYIHSSVANTKQSGLQNHSLFEQRLEEINYVEQKSLVNINEFLSLPKQVGDEEVLSPSSLIIPKVTLDDFTGKMLRQDKLIELQNRKEMTVSDSTIKDKENSKESLNLKTNIIDTNSNRFVKKIKQKRKQKKIKARRASVSSVTKNKVVQVVQSKTTNTFFKLKEEQKNKKFKSSLGEWNYKDNQDKNSTLKNQKRPGSERSQLDGLFNIRQELLVKKNSSLRLRKSLSLTHNEKLLD